MKYDFDNLADRSIDNARKWDEGIVLSKFPTVKKDFIPMWIADMDFKAAPEIRNALSNMAMNGAYGYTYSTERWFNSVINWQKKRHEINVKREWVTLGYGTVPNMHILVQEFLKEKSDSIIINTPIYGPFAYAAIHNNRRVISIPLVKKGSRYYIDFELLEAKIKTEKPKMMFFCNPHNPSGRIWTYDELVQVADICLRHNVLLVSDEVHSEHIMSGKFISALKLPDKYLDNLVMLTSPNKAFNLGGLKLSYSIIPNSEIRSSFRRRYVANSVTSPNVPGQIAMTIAYESCDKWLEECQKYIFENLQVTKEIISQMEGWSMMDMDASYLPWIDISGSGYNMHEIANMMASEAGVIVGVGDDYVQNAENYLRLNLGTSKKMVTEAMTRMYDVWNKIVRN